MESVLGWTQISRASVQRAEEQLTDTIPGTMDELGLLEIHQGYADRFFPGTSVQHTRLRYVLFVVWIYDSVKHLRVPPEDIDGFVAHQEHNLGKALILDTHSWGVIGRRTLPKKPNQRPSIIYWGALGTWGLLHRKSYGGVPSRAEVHRILANPDNHVVLFDDEGRSLRRDVSPFCVPPQIPGGWRNSKEIDFTLTASDKAFLSKLLERVAQPDSDQLSLLAQLVKAKAGKSLSRNSPLLCDEVTMHLKDHPGVKRADQAASLAAIVRGIYSVLVERLAITDGLGQRTDCLDNLNKVMNDHRTNALQLDLSQLVTDINLRTTGGLLDLLQQTLTWLGSLRANVSHSTVEPLLTTYRKQEQRRKGNRARLSSGAQSQRKEWWLDKARKKEVLPSPLHYRWNIVVRLLRDLEGKDD